MKWFRHRQKQKVRKFLSFHTYLTIFAATSEAVRNEQYAAMGALPSQSVVCGRDVPESLNHITYGQLDDLHDVPTGAEAIVNCCKVILGVSEAAVMMERADRVLWFASFCNKEVERINKIFASVQPEYEPEEKMAGIDKLKFGSFGVLDWYAKRMGISDQNAVRDVPWIRIYQCMKNDNEYARYEKRLRAVYRRKNQTKNTRR